MGLDTPLSELKRMLEDLEVRTQGGEGAGDSVRKRGLERLVSSIEGSLRVEGYLVSREVVRLIVERVVGGG